MKKRQLLFSCSHDACIKLASIISTYAHAAFPVGGSECAQATRESLLDMADRINNCRDDTVAINARQRPMLKSAINWYFADVETDDAQRNDLLERLQRSS